MKKLITPLGEISVYIDDIDVKYKVIRLKNDLTVFPNLDGRYKIEIQYDSDNLEHLICCVISNIDYNKMRHYPESGENLECQAFYQDDIKLSIGIECDTGYSATGERFSDYDYDNVYLENGIGYYILPITKSHKLTFGIAWINKYTDENELQTWFGADPTIM